MAEQGNSNDSMTAMVEFQIRPDNNSMREWLDVWSVRAADAHSGELETSAYATAINLDEPDNVAVFERYVKGSNSMALHTQRKAHDDLMQVMGERNMTKRRVMGVVFRDLPDFGFWSRIGSFPTEASRLTLLGLRFTKTHMQTRWLEMVGAHAEYCREQETSTLIYSAGLASQDTNKDIGALSGDVIVAMLTTNDAGIGVHQNDTRHLSLQAAFASEGIEREHIFTRRYQVTGDGYWWR